MPGQRYYGRNQYIEYYAGDLPYILSAPHGGALTPAEIPDRTYGTTTTDTHVEEAARAFIEAMVARTGHHPHVIICRLARIKLDANRDSVEGAQGNAYALQAWQEYHQFLSDARQAVIDSFSKGLYIDLHGHGHTIQRLELGYLLGASTLGLSDASLNQPSVVNASSVRALASVVPGGLAALLRGPRSLGAYFENRGYPAVPSSMQLAPGSDPYFNGGFDTERYGSKNGGTVDAIQIEANYTGVRDVEANYRRFAGTIAEVFEYYRAMHYDGEAVPTSPLVLNEFMFDVTPDSSGTPTLEGDANGDGMRSPRGDEFIEIVNKGTSPASLAGYRILEKQMETVFSFPDTAVLQPGQYAVVFGGVGPSGFGAQLPASAQYYAAKIGQADSGFASSSRTNYLGAGDNIVLLDPRSNVVFSEVYWGSAVRRTTNGQKLIAPYTFLADSIAGAIGQSITRRPDLTGKWTKALDVGSGALPYTPGVPAVVTSVREPAMAVPDEFVVDQNYPNPFNPSTSIRFGLPVRSHVRLDVFNVLGQHVATLLEEELRAGSHVARWNAQAPSGVYVYRILAVTTEGMPRSFTGAGRMVLVK